MATLKVQQKLSLGAFKTLSEQIKSSGVHIINKVDGNVVTADDVIGRVGNAFLLGAKIEVQVPDKIDTKATYRFEKIADSYYLVHGGK